MGLVFLNYYAELNNFDKDTDGTCRRISKECQ